MTEASGVRLSARLIAEDHERHTKSLETSLSTTKSLRTVEVEHDIGKS